MLKKVLKSLSIFLLTAILGVVLVYGGMRLLGLGLSFPREKEALTISTNTEGPASIPFPQPENNRVKNVILFNVAGMGINQMIATRYRYYGKHGRLHMERMPYVALVNNIPLGTALVSSPHAAATAIATGMKAYNGKLSPPGEKTYQTLLQKFQAIGSRAGIITNSYITGATTAAFGSNVQSRSQQREIAEQMITSKIDFLLGGGNEFYKDGFGTGQLNGEEYAQQHGYAVIKKKEQLTNITDSLVLGLFDGMYSNRYDDDVSFNPNNPTFKELIPIATQYLSRDNKGFFLLVDDEGADYGGYRNRADYLTQHLMAVDEAIGAALSYASENQETLVLVTAEAEAGGMVITGGDAQEGVLTFSWGSTRHTGQMVPLFAYGPGASLFTGVIENTEIHEKIATLMNF